MTSEAAAVVRGDRGGDVPGPPHGPRFALRFEDGRGRLALARPHRFAFGRVEELELSLGALQFPLDLSSGAQRFRTRRTRVGRAVVRLDLGAVLAALEEEPYRLDPLALRAGGLAVALHDALGVVAADASVRGSGADLEVVLANARAASQGPASPLARAIMAARGLGLRGDGATLRVPRALSLALREALVPWGWRVPDDRSVGVRLEWLSARRVRLVTLARGEDAARVDEARFEAARRLAPVVARLTHGDAPGAARLWLAEVERGADRSPELAAMARGLGVSAAPDQAWNESDPDAVAERAFALDEGEPCDAVAVEALCAAADLALGDRPALAARLLERACARRPGDARIGLRLVELLARGDDAAALDEAIAAALRAQEPGLARARFARGAATLCMLAGKDARAGRLAREAAAYLPDDADVLEALAAAFVAEGELERAIDALDRAAAAHLERGARDAAAAALSRGGGLAAREGLDDVAEDRAARAAALEPSAERWAELALVRARLGADAAADRARDQLLSSLDSVSPEALPALARDALVAAVEAALDSGRRPRARRALALLARLAPRDPALEALLARQAAEDLASWREAPERLLSLPPARAIAYLEAEPDLDALVRAIAEAAPEALSEVAPQWLASAASAALVAALAEHADLRDARALNRLASASDGEARAQLAERALEALGADGDLGEMALARGLIASARRDMAGLRAALAAAERADADDVSRAIVELALGVVGEGPARAALLAVQRRLSPPNE